MLFRICLMGVCCAMLTSGAPLNDSGAMNYLAQFGYLDPAIMKPNSQVSNYKKKIMLKEALKDFQNFIGLTSTGKVDAATNIAMKQPRCGEKDKLSPKDLHTRGKRYSHWGVPWEKYELTYKIHQYPKGVDLSKAAVNEEMALAFAVWENVTDFELKQVSGSADINISFFQGKHGDEKPFDGRGMVLGHAKSPTNGEVHFDDDELWTIRRSYGQNLFLVAVHEFGHALGLSHSNVNGSIMQPMLNKGYERNFMLHDDDIKGLQHLYRKKKNKPPDLCSDSTFDAIFEDPDEIIYVLKKKYYWKLSQDGFVNSYPLLISHRWPGLPENIDAALATSSGRTYFFKDNKYWAYEHTYPLPGHPKLISEGWPGIPDNIDAATWYTRSVFYFFKGDEFWAYDSHQSPNVNTSYPQPMSKWGNIIGDLGDVMYMRSGYIYFFCREGIYYRYNCKTKLVDPGWPDQPDYPREIGPWWFRCRGNSAMNHDDKYEDNKIHHHHFRI